MKSFNRRMLLMALGFVSGAVLYLLVQHNLPLFMAFLGGMATAAVLFLLLAKRPRKP